MANPVPWYRRLRLTTDPFAPDPALNDWILATPQWRIQADSLVKTALEGTFIGLVKGDVGSGKTTLLHQVMDALGGWPDVQVLHVACRDDGSLLRRLAPGVELGMDPYPALVAHLDCQCRQGLRPVALIDDAHLLSKDDLELLVRFSQPRQEQAPPLLHTVLFADAAIQPRLNELDLSWATVPINALIPLPLTAAQTGEYLRHRLAVAGLKDFPLSPRQVNTIHRAGGGLPGAVNHLAGGMLTRRHGAWWSPLLRRPTLPRLPAFLKTGPGSRKRTLGLSAGVATLTLTGVVLAQWLPLPDTDPTAAKAVETLPGDAPAPTLRALPLPRRDATAAATPAEPEAVTVTSAIPASPAPGSGSTDPGQLHDPPGGHYLIQLLSGTREQDLVKAVGEQPLPDTWGYFPRRQGGRTWYIAVMGPYPDQDQARDALAALPQSLRRHQPLIRSVASLQPDLGGIKTP